MRLGSRLFANAVAPAHPYGEEAGSGLVSEKPSSLASSSPSDCFFGQHK